MKDSFLHKGQRKKLIEELEKKGISNKSVLNAIEAVPRHLFFLDKVMELYAYEDKAYPIGAGQTISQPYTVAIQTHLLDIKPNEKVLEIGTGSGYQAAVLSKLGVRVFSIERQKDIYFRTKKLLQELHIFIETILGDGFKGLPQFAPFDKIIITAAAPFIPRPLLEQLKIGGILVVPLGEGMNQKMLKIIKISETEFEQTEHGTFSFVPMIGGTTD
jgi:protein-L-isoaspartate(D-aspartate) O-methyltransferase